MTFAILEVEGTQNDESGRRNHHGQQQMNGFAFNLRVLEPWARDPAFYATVWTGQSDTPAHEGPCAHGLVELWTYSFPLSRNGEEIRALIAKE